MGGISSLFSGIFDTIGSGISSVGNALGFGGGGATDALTSTMQPFGAVDTGSIIGGATDIGKTAGGVMGGVGAGTNALTGGLNLDDQLKTSQINAYNNMNKGPNYLQAGVQGYSAYEANKTQQDYLDQQKVAQEQQLRIQQEQWDEQKGDDAARERLTF